MDESYKYLTNTFMKINLDRYKTYFTQFIFLHLGIIFALTSGQLASMAIILTLVGVGLSLVWVTVLVKIGSDIEKTWKQIIAYENDPKNHDHYRLSDLKLLPIPASSIMISVPAAFLSIYILLLLRS